MGRARMGQVIAKLGGRATARPSGPSSDKAITQRERTEKGRALERAGKNKGEQLGYGVARYHTET